MAAHAVHLSSVHYAYDTRIFHRECKSLAGSGYRVTLIAAHQGADHLLDGVQVRTVPVPRTRVERMFRTIPAIYRRSLNEDADIYHFHDPELLAVGALLRMHGKKVIYDVHEDYAGTMSGKEWIPRWLHGAAALTVSLCEAVLSSACDRIVAATPTIARKFPGERTCLVQNFPRLQEFERAGAMAYRERAAMAVYVGWLGDHSGVRCMQEAVEIAGRSQPLELVIAGKVREGAKAEFLGDERSSRVRYAGFLSRPAVAELIGRARIGMVTVQPTRNTLNAQPTKLFEYMAGGIPVIASDFPVYRQFVEQAQCGLLADPEDSQAVAEAMLYLLRHPDEAEAMGENGRRAIEERYNWEREAGTLTRMYAELESESRNAATVGRWRRAARERSAER